MSFTPRWQLDRRGDDKEQCHNDKGGSPDGAPLAGGRTALHPQIRMKVHGIVQSIREVRHADDQRQLDDLVREVLASLFVRTLAQRRGPRVTRSA